MKVLVIEPFYTGSHNLALEMEFDRILCSGFFNLALFKSFVLKERKKIAPCYMYMHENQISYPWSGTDPDPRLRRDQHYGFIDLMNVFLADKIFFNSEFHKQSFFSALPDFCAQFPEDYFSKKLHSLEEKSSVLAIGLELQGFAVEQTKKNLIPIILWNHRWEYDKNPELFFKPKIFAEAEAKLEDEIIHFGYVKSREDYCNYLKQADILPVTSKHDFFGISVVEAIAAGCVPLLPFDLSYPEHISPEDFPALFYTADTDYMPALRSMMKNIEQYQGMASHVKKYDWEHMKRRYKDALSS